MSAIAPIDFTAVAALFLLSTANIVFCTTHLSMGGVSQVQQINTLRIRGGSDLHTGKFVIEHRRSNNTMMQRQASSVSSLDDCYDVHGVLGEGGFATVRKGIHRITKNVYAIKTIDLCKIRVDQLDSLRNEVNIMKMLDHPNVVKLYETFEEENKLHLVLELCEGGDLFEFIMKTSIESGQKTWSDGSVCRVFDFRVVKTPAYVFHLSHQIPFVAVLSSVFSHNMNAKPPAFDCKATVLNQSVSHFHLIRNLLYPRR